MGFRKNIITFDHLSKEINFTNRQILDNIFCGYISINARYHYSSSSHQLVNLKSIDCFDEAQKMHKQTLKSILVRLTILKELLFIKSLEESPLLHK